MDDEQKPQDFNIETSDQNKPQQQLSIQANNYRENKINLKLVVLIISSILGSIIFVFAIILPVYKSVKSIFYGPSLSEYESYLAKKYRNDTFYYVSGNPSCVWFNTGSCEVLFSSTSLNGTTFEVYASHHYDYGFSDNYYQTKYGFDFKKFYYEKYGGKLFENVISQSAPRYVIETTIINRSQTSTLKGPFNSFNDFLTQLEQQGNNNIDIYLTLYSNITDIYNLDWLDFTSIESEVSKVIIQNDLKPASVNLVVENNGKEYIDSVCPKEFDHTIRSPLEISYRDNTIGAEDEPDGRSIKGCLRTIFSKT